MTGFDALMLLPIALFAGAVRGLSGFAGPLIMVPALGFFYDPVSVIGTSSLVDLSCNLALFRDAVRQASLATVAKVVAGATLFVPLGAYVLLAFDTHFVAKVIYGAVALFAVVLLAGWRYKRGLSTPMLLGVGAVNGLIVGATSFGVAMVPFLHAGPESTLQGRANFILWALFCAVIGFAVVTLGGRMGETALLRAAILAPPYIAGTFVGNLYSKRIDALLLRRVVLALLLVAAVAGLASQMGQAAARGDQRTGGPATVLVHRI